MSTEYYEILLTRKHMLDERIDWTTIGVGLQGQVVSYTYTWGYPPTVSRIQQYNGLDAEALARQMCEEADPPWVRAHNPRHPAPIVRYEIHMRTRGKAYKRTLRARTKAEAEDAARRDIRRDLAARHPDFDWFAPIVITSAQIVR